MDDVGERWGKRTNGGSEERRTALRGHRLEMETARTREL